MELRRKSEFCLEFQNFQDELFSARKIIFHRESWNSRLTVEIKDDIFKLIRTHGHVYTILRSASLSSMDKKIYSFLPIFFLNGKTLISETSVETRANPDTTSSTYHVDYGSYLNLGHFGRVTRLSETVVIQS